MLRDAGGSERRKKEEGILFRAVFREYLMSPQPTQRGGAHLGFEAVQTWACVSVLALRTCRAWGNFPNFSGFLFPLLQNGDHLLPKTVRISDAT